MVRIGAVVSTHVEAPPQPHIPLWKFSSTGHRVTEAESLAALGKLKSAEAHVAGESLWTAWLEFLDHAQAHGGFYIN